MFKIKKIDDKTSLAVDEVTGDPVATINTIRYPYSNKSTYHATWHPVINQLYQHSHQGFQYKDGVTADSKDGMTSSLENRYTNLVNDTYEKEPLEKEYKGKLTEESPDGYEGTSTKTRDTYHLMHEGKHVATLKVHNNTSNTSYNEVDYVGDQPTKDQLTILEKKNKDTTPMSLMKRVAHFQTIKNKEPSFVGNKTYNDAKSHMFKTSLTPELASAQYEKHLAKHPETKNAAVTRLSPTLFMVKAVSGNNTTHHIVDSSEPGVLYHHVSRIGQYTNSSTNSSVID